MAPRQTIIEPAYKRTDGNFSVVLEWRVSGGGGWRLRWWFRGGSRRERQYQLKQEATQHAEAIWKGYQGRTLPGMRNAPPADLKGYV